MKLEDYGCIGDMETMALVGRDGTIDWLCVPRFDSAAVFAQLLGTEENGAWRIAPKNAVRGSYQTYRHDTLVLETTFECDSGAVKVIDFMPPRVRGPEVFHIVEGIRGSVPMRMQLTIRFDYGKIVPWVSKRAEGTSAIAGPDALQLYSDVPTDGEGMSTVAEFEVKESEVVVFSLIWHPSHENPPPREDAHARLEETEKFWREWCARSTYHGEWRDEVMRSLITLKALTYAPTGGVVAAATTSLPELIGGVRNWDYRYCWLRDATFTLMSFMAAGYTEEAIAWRDWLLRAAAGDAKELQIMYGPAGERRLSEYEVDWLEGYEESKPVRVGNAAAIQFQLDVYGEVIDAMHQARSIGVPADDFAWRLVLTLLEFLEDAWKEPDEGIWEVRGPRRHFTHSKVMAWVCFDRAVKAVEKFKREGPVEKWAAIRDEIHEQICKRGFNRELNAFTQSYGSEFLDASLLIMPLVGFLPADDPRVVSTVAAIETHLMQDGFLQRYDPRASDPVDALPPGQGAFLPCSFWLVDNYLLLGRTDEARELFERLLATANPLGLLAEEYDPRAKRLIGNFPQAFSHVGLVNTAHNIADGHCPSSERPK